MHLEVLKNFNPLFSGEKLINTLISVVIILIVSLISLILFIVGFLSYRKSRDIRLLSVTAAFGVFFVKNLFTAISLYYNIVPHGDLELYESCLDLVALVLLLIPVFKKIRTDNLTG